MSFLSESELERALLQFFEELGYQRSTDAEIGPEGFSTERESYGQVILEKRLIAAIERLNPNIPSQAHRDAIRILVATETPSLIEENRRLHRLIVEGVGVEYYDRDGTIRGDHVRLIDFESRNSNDWSVISQLTVIEDSNHRRPDVVLYVNGLPLAVIELKSPADENATLEGAFNQLQTYKHDIPSLFRTNAVLVTSDGLHARIGSLTADLERFMPWRTVDGSTIAPTGAPELRTVVKGVFDKTRFLTLIRDFTVFEDTGSGHRQDRGRIPPIPRRPSRGQEARSPPRGRTATVASGSSGIPKGPAKSLLMAFYAGQIIVHSARCENPTVVVITDRNDLDDQLFGTFSMCRRTAAPDSAAGR